MADIRRETAADGEILVLSGELTIRHLQAIKAGLADSLRSASPVRVRLENVRELDIAFLQLLCSAHRTAADDNKPFTIDGDRDLFLALLNKSGFRRHIGCRDNGRFPCLWLCDN